MFEVLGAFSIVRTSAMRSLPNFIWSICVKSNLMSSQIECQIILNVAMQYTYHFCQPKTYFHFKSSRTGILAQLSLVLVLTVAKQTKKIQPTGCAKLSALAHET